MVGEWSLPGCYGPPCNRSRRCRQIEGGSLWEGVREGLEKSDIITLNSSGLMDAPWGTLFFTGLYSDKRLPNLTLIDLFGGSAESIPVGCLLSRFMRV